MTLPFAAPGTSVGRFTVVHALPRRIRLTSAALRSPDFDATYFQALLEALPGVDAVRVNSRGGSLVLSFDGRKETWDKAAVYLQAIPGEAYLAPAGSGEATEASEVAAKAVLTVLGQLLPPPFRGAASWAASFETLLVGAETLLSRGVKVQVLDAMAVGLSLLRGNYFTAGSISTLLAMGEYLEGQSEQRSVALLKSLLRPQSDHVWVIRDGREIRIAADDVVPGDRAVFGAGEAVAIDGLVLEGEASVNQSSISGESVPVHLKPGDSAISGSVVDEGRLVVKVERVGAETSVARIGRFIDQSLRNKSKRQTKSSELADSLVPITLGLAVLGWLLTRDMNRVASVLTVDFSCAVKLASPIAVRSGMYAAGQAGVLLKGAPALDALQDVDTLVFDKTGTLTTGQLEVTDVLPVQDLPSEELLSLAAGAEEHYDHPVARAVVSEAAARGLDLPPISRVDFIVAHGVSAFIDGKNILVGGYHFLAEDEGVTCGHMEETAGSLREQGKSLLYVAREGVLIGLIALRDTLRPEAPAVLDALKQEGIRRIVVLTGDHKDTALALQRSLPQIDEVRYELKPEDKALVVEELKRDGRYLAFVGDGVNDAPALVNAHVGICMPGGADLAKEAARVLLLKEDLRVLLHARKAANRTNAVIRRCFGATIGCNSLTVLLAALKGLQPAAAALLHNLSTIGILGYAGMAASQPLHVPADKAAPHAD